jgi:hypothetical protein
LYLSYKKYLTVEEVWKFGSSDVQKFRYWMLDVWVRVIGMNLNY